MKRSLLFVCLIITLICGAFFSAYTYRIKIANWAIKKAVQQFNIPPVQLTIAQFDFQQVHLRNIIFDDKLKINSLQLDYSLSTLLNKTIERLTLSGVYIDVSTPNQGALGHFQSLISTNSNKKETAFHLPETIITDVDVNLHKTSESANFNLNARLSPDRSGAFQITGHVASRDIELKQLSLEGTIAKNFANIDFTLNKAIASSVAKTPMFTPLQITGTGHFKAPQGHFNFDITDEKQNLHFNVNGLANIEDLSGKARLSLDDITFSPDGLQPQNLSPLAQLPTPLDATISGQADVLFKNSTPDIKATLQLKNARLSIPPQKTRDVHINANTHLTYNFADKKADLTLNDITVEHKSSAPFFQPLRLTGNGRYNMEDVFFNADITLQNTPSQALITAKGKHSLIHKRGNAKINIPPMSFSPSGLKPTDLSPVLSMIEQVTGTLSASSHINWQNNKVTTQTGEMTLSGVNLKTDTLQAHNINTKLRLSKLWPPQTQGVQTITLDELFSGISLGQPKLNFSLKKQILNIQDFHSNLIGGQISVDNFIIDPKAKKHDLTVQVSQLNLEELFTLLELDGVAGTGHLTGKIPVSLENNDLVIRNAKLATDNPGVLQFKSEKAKQVLGGAGEQVDLLLRVLSNFHYEKLSLIINRELSHNAIVNLRIEGKNPDVMEARPFNLNINLEGNIDKLIAVVLEGYRLSDKAIRSTVGAGQ